MIRASFSMGGHFHMNFFSPHSVCVCRLSPHHGSLLTVSHTQYLRCIKIGQFITVWETVRCCCRAASTQRHRSLSFASICSIFSFSIKNNFLFESIHTIAPGHNTRSTVLSTNQIKPHTKWSRDLWKSSQIIGYLTTAHARTHTCIRPSIRCKWTLVFPLWNDQKLARIIRFCNLRFSRF